MAKDFQITVNDFTGGINDLDDNRELANNQWTGYNWDLVGRGSLQKRYGYDLIADIGDKPIRGLISYKRSTGEKRLLSFTDGKVYSTDEGGFTKFEGMTGSGSDNEVRMNGAVYNNLAIFGDGIDSLRKYDPLGVLKDSLTGGTNTYTLLSAVSEAASDRQTLSVPSEDFRCVSIEIEAASRGTGNWIVIAHDAANNELGRKELTPAEVSLSGFTTFTLDFVSLTTSPLDHFHVIQSTADGTLKVGTASDMETANFKFNIAIDVLGGNPPFAKIFEVHPRLLFVSGVRNAESVIYWSDLDDPENWSTGISGNTPLALNDGSNVSGLKIHNDQIIGFKEFSKYGLTEILNSSSDILGFTQREIVDKSDGCLSGNTISSVWDGYYFIGEKGFQKYGIAENFPDRRTPSSLSFLIKNQFDNINRAEIEKSTAEFWDNKYYCACPVNNSKTNNFLFVLNKQYPSLPWQNWQSINASDLALFEDSTGKRDIYFGSEQEGKIYKLNKKFSDAVSGIESFGIRSFYRSKTFSNSLKNRYNEIVINGAMTKPCSFILSIYVDDKKQSFTITESDILRETIEEGVIGSEVIGTTIIGGEISSNSDVELFSFRTIIHFPDEIKTGEEVYIEILHTNNNEGLRINNFTILGTKLSGILPTA